MRPFEQPSFFNAGFLPWSSGIPWHSPYTSNIAELPKEWSPEVSSWFAPITIGFAGPAMGIPFGVSVAALFANAWAMVSNFPGGFTNPYGSSMNFRPPVRSAGAERGEGSSGPRFSRMQRGPAGESDELDGADEAPDGAAGAPAAGDGKTTDPSKLSDPKYGGWSTDEIASAKKVRGAAYTAAKSHPKFTVSVNFGPGKKQVTLYAAPKKGSGAPSEAERAAVQTALSKVPRHGLSVNVVVGKVGTTGSGPVTSSPVDPQAAAKADIAAENNRYVVIVAGARTQVCKIELSGTTLSVNVLVDTTQAATEPYKGKIAAAKSAASSLATKHGLTYSS